MPRTYIQVWIGFNLERGVRVRERGI